MFQVPAFTLEERSGQPFDSKTMAGKVWVCDFFFASCPAVCPMLNKQMEKIHQATHDLPDVHLLSIATDMADTPEVLRKYATDYGADDRWSMVTDTKDKDAITKLSNQGFKLSLVENGGAGVETKIDHSTKIALVDKHGWIRAYYDGIGENAEQEKDRLLADIKRLLAEP